MKTEAPGLDSSVIKGMQLKPNEMAITRLRGGERGPRPGTHAGREAHSLFLSSPCLCPPHVAAHTQTALGQGAKLAQAACARHCLQESILSRGPRKHSCGTEQACDVIPMASLGLNERAASANRASERVLGMPLCQQGSGQMGSMPASDTVRVETFLPNVSPPLATAFGHCDAAFPLGYWEEGGGPCRAALVSVHPPGPECQLETSPIWQGQDAPRW